MMPERNPDCLVKVYLSDKGFSAVVHLADTSVPFAAEFADGHTYDSMSARLLEHMLNALKAFKDEMNNYGEKNGCM